MIGAEDPNTQMRGVIGIAFGMHGMLNKFSSALHQTMRQFPCIRTAVPIYFAGVHICFVDWDEAASANDHVLPQLSMGDAGSSHNRAALRGPVKLSRTPLMLAISALDVLSRARIRSHQGTKKILIFSHHHISMNDCHWLPKDNVRIVFILPL